MKTLYKFNLDCGRMGHVESIFVEDDAIVKKSLGKEVNFGEILGKHSEVYCNLSESHLTVLSQDPQVCEIIETHIGSTGHCPLDYIDSDGEECTELDDEEDWDEEDYVDDYEEH